MTNFDTKLMQTYKTVGDRRDMIKESYSVKLKVTLSALAAGRSS